MAAWADTAAVVIDSTRVVALDWNWTTFWSNQWTVGIGTGVVVGLVVWYITSRSERRHRPTADEIAEAQYRQKRAREDEIHAVAAELYDIVGTIRQQSSFYVDNLIKEHMLEKGFEEVAESVETRWQAVANRLAVLERDDIPPDSRHLVEGFVSAARTLVEQLEPLREQGGVRKQELRQFVNPFIGMKYEAEALQGKIDQYRLRFRAPRD